MRHREHTWFYSQNTTKKLRIAGTVITITGHYITKKTGAPESFHIFNSTHLIVLANCAQNRYNAQLAKNRETGKNKKCDAE
ncbi:hypothetical protein QUQ70_000966 [Escherichia coli]|nr:hypothetical protein [Escherichia coli]